MTSTTEQVRCSRCGGPSAGYKCDVCGADSPVHVEAHRCGSAHCMPKCAGCYEAEALCECEVTSATSRRSPKAP